MNTETLRNRSYDRQAAEYSFVSELVKLGNDILPVKTDNIQLSRRISAAKAIWKCIPHEIREGILNLVIYDKKDNKARAEKKDDKARAEKTGIYLARKLALCEENIPPHEFIKPESICTFLNLAERISFTVEFSFDDIKTRKNLPLRSEMMQACRRKMYVQGLLVKNLDAVAGSLLGKHYALSRQDDRLALFRAQDENPDRDGISLEFDIDHKTGTVTARSIDLFDREFSVDVTDSLDDPCAMAQKIREAGEREEPAMRM